MMKIVISAGVIFCLFVEKYLVFWKWPTIFIGHWNLIKPAHASIALNLFNSSKKQNAQMWFLPKKLKTTGVVHLAQRYVVEKTNLNN
jgi:hypothetical protein